MGRLVTKADNPTVLYVSGGNTQVGFAFEGMNSHFVLFEAELYILRNRFASTLA